MYQAVVFKVSATFCCWLAGSNTPTTHSTLSPALASASVPVKLAPPVSKAFQEVKRNNKLAFHAQCDVAIALVLTSVEQRINSS